MDKSQLENKLQALKIPADLIGVNESSFYIDYVLKFAPAITFNKIKARKKDIEIFFDCPVAIRNDAGNIILRTDKTQRPPVLFSNYINYLRTNKNGDGLPAFFGVDDVGNDLIVDVARLPHLLVSGTTGAGKSVFLHNLILSTIFTTSARLVLIDVKKVEFNYYNGLKLNATPNKRVIDDAMQAGHILRDICAEIDAQYKIYQSLHVRTFSEYKKKNPDALRTLIVIDEIADLMLQNKQIEKYLVRIAQIGRACGYHLILATQRPSTDVITGLIKSNIPARVSFRLPSFVDSHTILDASGAEMLRGAGDGLYKNPAFNGLKRFQSAYISDSELAYITAILTNN